MQDYQKQNSARSQTIKNIYMAIYRSGHITKRGLQSETALSWGTVTSVVDLLVNSGFVVPVGKAFTNGRSATYYAIKTDIDYIVGIDLNTTGLSVISSDCYGRIKKHEQAPADCINADSFLRQMISLTKSVISKTPGHPLGIGIAVQGALDINRGLSSNTYQIPDWKNICLKRIVEENFDTKVFLLHDPDCINIAEQSLGANKEYYNRGNVAIIRADAGVGISMMINGHLSTNGYSSEIGHICVEENGPKCKCGNAGCLEEYASFGGISSRYAEKSGEHNISAFEIAERSLNGDGAASEVIEAF